jgi:sec-independent protein translocase protein TatC
MTVLAIAAVSLWRAAAVVLLASLAAGLVYFFRVQRTPDGSFLDHVDDLRKRIIVSLAAVLTAAAFLFSFDWPAHQLYPQPALSQNLAARLFQRVASDLVPDTVQLVVARPMDGFAAELGIAFAAALLIMSPIVLWQLGGFFWPALRKQEQRILLQSFAPILVLFLSGAAFAYVFVLPFLLRTLYEYGAALGAQGLLPVSDLISFVMGMVLIMGLAFQTPLVMWALTRVGVVGAKFWQKYWRHAVVVIFIASAIVTDPTFVSQLLVAAPLILLYVLGIGLSRGAERAHLKS